MCKSTDVLPRPKRTIDVAEFLERPMEVALFVARGRLRKSCSGSRSSRWLRGRNP